MSSIRSARPAICWPHCGDLALLLVLHQPGQAAFLALLILGGAVALVEAALFYYVGRLVDILDSANQADGWAGLIAASVPRWSGCWW